MSPDPTPDDAIAAWLTTPEQAARISPTPDLAELRRLAEAATPGPWYGADELSLLIENERATEDIPYLAAANPAAVLALLDAAAERDALREDLAELEEVGGRLSHLLCDLTGGLLSKATYPVPVMVQAIEEHLGKYYESDAQAKVERVRDWLDHRGVDVSDRDGAYMDGYRAAQRHALQDAAELRRALDEEPQP